MRTTWIDAFPKFYSNADWYSNEWGDEWFYHFRDEESLIQIGSAIASEFAEFDTQGLYQISKSTFDRMLHYYVEIGLVVDEGEKPFTTAGDQTARRYSILGGSGEAFQLLKGKVSLKALSMADDEIPF